jgi:hypothetical protein
MTNAAPPCELPANASRACPGCGGPWTYGYVVKRLPNQPGGRGKKIYKRALECRNDGCGLGYFVGSEITHAETEGLELIDYETRKREVLRMAENETKKRPWSKDFERCRDCGGTDKPHYGRGLCQTCYMRHKKAGTSDQFPTTKRVRKKGAVGPAAAPACTVALPEDLYRILEKLGRISNATVDKVAAVVIRNYLGDLGISAGPAGKR